MNNNEQLPAYLRRRDGRLELVLHATWCQDYDLCGEKFDLRYRVQVEAAGPKVALVYGAAVHNATEAWALGKPLDEQLAAMQAEFDERPQPADEWRSRGRAADLVRAFNEWAAGGATSGGATKADPAAWEANCPFPAGELEVLGVEENFEVLVGEVEIRIAPFVDPINGRVGNALLTVPCYLAGRKDLIVRWHDGLWVWDWKTASDWGEDLGKNTHLLEGRMSFQFRGYAWAEQAMKATMPEAVAIMHPDRVLLPVMGTCGCYLVSRRPYVTQRANGAKATVRNQFHIESYAYEQRQLDEWRDEFLAMCGDVLRDWSNQSFRRKRTGCGHWGRCEFYGYCEARPEEREQLLTTSEFQPKVIEREL